MQALNNLDRLTIGVKYYRSVGDALAQHNAVDDAVIHSVHNSNIMRVKKHRGSVWNPGLVYYQLNLDRPVNGRTKLYSRIIHETTPGDFEELTA